MSENTNTTTPTTPNAPEQIQVMTTDEVQNIINKVEANHNCINGIKFDTKTNLPVNRNYGDIEVERNGIKLTYRLKARRRKTYTDKSGKISVAPPLNAPDITLDNLLSEIIPHFGPELILRWIEDKILTNCQTLAEDFYSPDLSKRDDESYIKALQELTAENETKGGLAALEKSLRQEFIKATEAGDQKKAMEIMPKIVQCLVKISELAKKKSEE